MNPKQQAVVRSVTLATIIVGALGLWSLGPLAALPLPPLFARVAG